MLRILSFTSVELDGYRRSSDVELSRSSSPSKDLATVVELQRRKSLRLNSSVVATQRSVVQPDIGRQVAADVNRAGSSVGNGGASSQNHGFTFSSSPPDERSVDGNNTSVVGESLHGRIPGVNLRTTSLVVSDLTGSVGESELSVNSAVLTGSRGGELVEPARELDIRVNGVPRSLSQGRNELGTSDAGEEDIRRLENGEPSIGSWGERGDGQLEVGRVGQVGQVGVRDEVGLPARSTNSIGRTNRARVGGRSGNRIAPPVRVLVGGRNINGEVGDDGVWVKVDRTSSGRQVVVNRGGVSENGKNGGVRRQVAFVPDNNPVTREVTTVLNSIDVQYQGILGVKGLGDVVREELGSVPHNWAMVQRGIRTSYPGASGSFSLDQSTRPDEVVNLGGPQGVATSSLFGDERGALGGVEVGEELSGVSCNIAFVNRKSLSGESVTNGNLLEESHLEVKDSSGGGSRLNVGGVALSQSVERDMLNTGLYPRSEVRGTKVESSRSGSRNGNTEGIGVDSSSSSGGS